MTRGQPPLPETNAMKLREMDEKNMHNLFLKNMAGLIEETKNPSPCLNPQSKRGGMATHAGVALELGIHRPAAGGKASKVCMSPQMEAILIWCQCRTRDYENVNITNFTNCWADGLAFCALIHHFFPQAFDFSKLTKENRKQNYELAFQTGERLAGIPDFISGDDMDEMISSGRLDPKVVFAYVQEVYRALKDNQPIPTNPKRLGGIPDFLTSEDMTDMVIDNRIDPKMVFSYVQEVYRMCNDL